MNSPHRIICNNCPSDFILDKKIAKDYFKQFGKLKKLHFRPRQKICIVEYADSDGYLNALNHAGEYQGTIVNVSKEKQKSLVKKQESQWMDEDEIKAELEAMSGYAPKTYKSLEGITPEKVAKPKRVWKNEGVSKPKKTIKSKEDVNLRISGEEVDLVNIILSPAFTSEEKYKRLDARDKLLRIKLKKTPTTKQGPTVGTCPDMCPEKERLFREIKHQVAWYEQDLNFKSMNHNKAVKQYSRSSADQEAPLSHELRPVSVLQMTMDYLLENIVDLCDADEVHLGEWFHFLWDRTRGIRKDITQQELCSQGAVDLVEQCTRLHIHCSARLVAEDPSVFDQKINTENLTKCLQTLKYMYHDLLLRGESCKNEAEFRAYIILLNLNDGNFMWEVQQLRREIQTSKEVIFALHVHSAIDKNNFIKFFKLVNSTSYLNACLLMRYFVQVRVMALKTLAKCYIPRAAKTFYPLVELENSLAFDDIDSTIDFLHYHGFTLNDENTHVILDKQSFLTPELPYMLDRSMVIENKRQLPISKIISGKDLPVKSYNHKIQNSFDSKGFLIYKDVIDLDLDLEKVKLKLMEELKQSELEITTNKKKLPEENSNKLPEKIFIPPNEEKKSNSNQKVNPFSFSEEEKKIEPFKSGSSTKKEEKIANPFAINNNEEVNKFHENTFPVTKNIFSSQFTFTSTTKNQDEPDFVTTNKDIFSLTPTITNKPPLPPPQTESKKGGFSFNLYQPPPINNKPLQETKVTLSEDIQRKRDEIQLKLAEEQKKLKLLEEQKEKELRKRKQEEELEKRLELIRKEELKLKNIEKEKQAALEREKEKEIQISVKRVLNNLINGVDDKIRNDKLQIMKENIQRRLVLKMIHKWKLGVSKNKRKRKALDCGPVWINSKTLKRTAEDLQSSSQDLTLSLMKRYRRGKALDIGQIVDEHFESINLYQLTYNILKNRIYEQSVIKPNDIFWKVLISLPDKNELENGLNRITEMIDSAFSWKKKKYLDHIRVNSSESVTYCIEKQEGLVVSNFDANAIIFIAKDFNSYLQRRIFENLKGFGVYNKIAIVVILQDYNREDCCKLETLIEENIVSNYNVIEEKNLSKLLNSIEQGLIFLSKSIENSPPLESDSLRSFLKKYLCSEIWKRANSFAKWNSSYKKCLQNPNLVLTLYNEALNRLKAIILNESNQEYPVFPDEFKKYLNSETPDFLPCSYRYIPKFWKNKKYLKKLGDTLKKLTLPKWQTIWPLPNEYELELAVFDYCSKLSKEPMRFFYKVMSLMLRNIDPTENFADIENILWTDIVEILGLELLDSDILTLPDEFLSESSFKEYFAVYNVDILNEYRFCDWFYIYNPKVKKMLKPCLDDSIKTDNKISPTKMVIDDNFIDSIRNKYLKSKFDKDHMIKEINTLNKSIADLTDCMEVHKRISFKIDESLREAIAEK